MSIDEQLHCALIILVPQQHHIYKKKIIIHSEQWYQPGEHKQHKRYISIINQCHPTIHYTVFLTAYGK